MSDLIDRQAAIDRIDEALKRVFKEPCGEAILANVPSAQPERNNKEFIKLTVRNSNGRPYYSIIYLEIDKNGVGHDFEGYSSYDLDVISAYLKNDFGIAQSDLDEWCTDCSEYDSEKHCCPRWNRVIRNTLKDAQPERNYTNEELEIFRHGISLSLLSKRSAQHWRYDEDTAKEIEFLERLYNKVVEDMRGKTDG